MARFDSERGCRSSTPDAVIGLGAISVAHFTLNPLGKENAPWHTRHSSRSRDPLEAGEHLFNEAYGPSTPSPSTRDPPTRPTTVYEVEQPPKGARARGQVEGGVRRQDRSSPPREGAHEGGHARVLLPRTSRSGPSAPRVGVPVNYLTTARCSGNLRPDCLGRHRPGSPSASAPKRVARAWFASRLPEQVCSCRHPISS